MPPPEAAPLLAPAILIYERTPRLEPDLKRLLGSPKLLVRPCRSINDMIGLCAAMPGSVAVIDFDASPQQALRLLEQLKRGRYDARPLVVAGVEWQSLEWAAREAGAVCFVPATTPARVLCDHCQRLIVQTS